jgi:Zc3h12a-like Ribonuclease NYN domain
MDFDMDNATPASHGRPALLPQASMPPLPQEAVTGAASTARAHDARVTSAALALLLEGLRPFVASSVRAALGEDMYAEYLPPDDVDCYGMLKYVRKKWLSVFADTSLDPLSSTIDRLTDTAYVVRQTSNSVAKDTADSTISEVQAVLLAIRKSALASSVASLSNSHTAAQVSTSLCLERAPPLSQSAMKYDMQAKVEQDVMMQLHQQHGQREIYGQHRPYQHQAERLDIDPTQHHPLHEQLRQDQPQNPDGSELRSPTVSVVVDGSNVAWRHGLSKRFSYRGIAECLAYFAQRQHPSVVFLPEARMRDAPPSAAASGFEGELEAFAALKALEGGPQLVLTPDNDYDDRFVYIRLRCTSFV